MASSPQSEAASAAAAAPAAMPIDALLGIIPAPALLLSSDGIVLAANARAAETIFAGARAGDAGGAALVGRPLGQLVTLAPADAPLAPGSRDATTRGPEVRRLVLQLAAREPHGAGFLGLLREPPLDERALHIRIAREKHDAIAQLATGVSHEFNNIMATLFGFAQLAAEDERYYRDLVAAVSEYAERSREITTRLRAFSREHDEPLTAVELDKVAELAIARIMPALERSRIRIQRRFADGLPATLGAPGALRDVIEVLLENARRSIVQGGEIVVEVARDGGTLLLSVSDTGTGIPRENLSRVFEPFFAMKAIEGGPVRGGLGLAVALAIVRRHQGDMWAESQLGRGTSIFARLPIRAERRRRQADIAVDRRRVTAPRTVLLVDAEESMLRLLESVLSGHQIVRALGGEDALRAVSAEPFDYAIIDPLLAGPLDGWATIGEITRKDPRVKMILLTAAPEDDRLRAAVARAYGYLRKPFGVKDVQSLVV